LRQLKALGQPLGQSYRSKRAPSNEVKMKMLAFASIALLAGFAGACKQDEAIGPSEQPPASIAPPIAKSFEPPLQADMIADGRDIAVNQCSRCHGIDHDKTSPRADAPPFATISQRYRIPVLADELMEGVKLGHPDMPKFELQPTGVDSLIAYLRSIQEANGKAPK
jgi:mono/diheme cytochrome c family protein